MTTVRSSRHVPRAHKVHFTGNPDSGRVDVRCESEVEFSLLRTDTGWVIALGSPDLPIRSALPTKVLLSAKDAYTVAVKRLWGK